jgi:8-oxo-dGTP pyrophosphatase MutT (NUDIX family)
MYQDYHKKKYDGPWKKSDNNVSNKKNLYSIHNRDNNVICLNCEKKGHTFKTCKYPINSYGIIAYKKIDGVYKYILIQRKDTIGYIDFIRGKYAKDSAKESVKILVEEMTEAEKTKIVTSTFREIWNNMWLNKKSSTYINEYNTSERKFKLFDKINLILGSGQSKFEDTNFEFPKGRKMKNETKLCCAIREFSEETGYKKSDIFINDTKSFSEIFYGTNTLVYRHTYYIAELKSEKCPTIDIFNMHQAEEIKQVELKTFKETINLFHSPAKRNLMYRVRDHIEKNII